MSTAGPCGSWQREMKVLCPYTTQARRGCTAVVNGAGPGLQSMGLADVRPVPNYRLEQNNVSQPLAEPSPQGRCTRTSPEVGDWGWVGGSHQWSAIIKQIDC